MFTNKLVCRLRAPLVTTIIPRRNKGGATDPVQQLFLDKIKEYRSKSPNDDLVEPSPAILKELQKELEKLAKNYGGGPGVDMTTFPTFKFEEVQLDPIDEAVPEKEGSGKKEAKKKKKKDPKKK